MTTAFAPERFHGSSLTMHSSPSPSSAPLVGGGSDSNQVHQLEIVWQDVTARPWYVELTERELNRLIALGEGWDGGRGRSTTKQALIATIQVLARLLDEESAAPQFFPLPDGGVQLEWLVAGNSVVIEIDARGEAYVLATTEKDSVVVEGVYGPEDLDLARHLQKFLNALSRLVRTAD